MILGKHI